MKTIWKFGPLKPGINVAAMPRGAEVLTMQNQNDNFVIWARVDSEAPSVDRRFMLIGTGSDMSGAGSWDHVATAQVESGLMGSLVFHLFAE